ncbi:hypothetical protein HYD77_02765 [Mycoplasmopsis bovis]|nr:hypothetical protein HYD77_02765 [Mycoplasmopsis bovis]
MDKNQIKKTEIKESISHFPSLFSSSENASIENAHRLLRIYIPKGKSIDKYVGQTSKTNS